MLRNHFLMNSNLGGENIYGHYDWCVKYTSKSRVSPFGIPLENVKKILVANGCTLLSDFYWYSEDNSAKIPVVQTHDVWDSKTKEGVLGFIGNEPGLFIALIDIIDSEGKSSTSYCGFNQLTPSSDVKHDYDISKIICPDNTEVISGTLCVSYSGQMHALEEYEFPKNLQLNTFIFQFIPNDAPFFNKTFIFKKHWTVNVMNADPYDFPHYMCTLKNIIVEDGNTVYDSRDNCGCVIHTESNSLYVSSTDCFIPNTVTSLSRGSFYQCKAPHISIPTSVTSIGKNAFMGCTGKVTYEGTVEQFTNIQKYNIFDNANNYTIECSDGIFSSSN